MNRQSKKRTRRGKQMVLLVVEVKPQFIITNWRGKCKWVIIY